MNYEQYCIKNYTKNYPKNHIQNNEYFMGYKHSTQLELNLYRKKERSQPKKFSVNLKWLF